jgi:hypothetical protein
MEYCDLWTEQTQIFCKMVKQRRLLTSIAIFTAVYMTAALGWWTYSLLQYNVAESKLQWELLENKKLLCNHKFQSDKFVKKHSNITENFSYIINTKDYNNLSLIANSCAKDYKMIAEINPRKIGSDSMVVKVGFSIPSAETAQIGRKLKNKQNAWLGEGITVGFITLIIIGLMYYYLEKIIRFNQQKTNFMMAVTHELKTPIAAAKLAIQTVIRNRKQRIDIGR